MKWIIVLTTIALNPGLVAPGPAIAQTANDLVGSWSIVSEETVGPDGVKFNPIGGPANGLVVFDGTGKFSWQIIRTDIPKLASNNRFEGTPEELKAVAQGVLSYFGSYSLEDGGKTIAMHIESSSFPNWNGINQKRTIALAGDNLTVTNPIGAADGSAIVTLKRLK
jgi:lipocalin-like protein